MDGCAAARKVDRRSVAVGELTEGPTATQKVDGRSHGYTER